MINKLPALETHCQSDVVHQKLSAIHSARKAYIEAESSEKISQALKHQTRSSTPHIFQNGDSVYYKRDSSKEWKGPGTVIGIENQTIIIKHGSVYVRVHPCRVMHENSEFKTKQIKDQKDNSQKRAACTDLTVHESLDSDSEENSQQKDSLDEMDQLIHMDNHVTTIGELDTNGSEIMDQEAIQEENMSGTNNKITRKTVKTQTLDNMCFLLFCYQDSSQQYNISQKMKPLGKLLQFLVEEEKLQGNTRIF